MLHFPIEELVESLGELQRGESVVLTLTGSLLDGSSFFAKDCVFVVGRGSTLDVSDAQ